jgi:hypothetical protein
MIMIAPIRVLLQTTIQGSNDDWSIDRFSLLRGHLASLIDGNDNALAEVTARNRESDENGDDPVLRVLDRSAAQVGGRIRKVYGRGWQQAWPRRSRIELSSFRRLQLGYHERVPQFCRRTARRCDQTQSAGARGHEGLRAQSRALALAFRSDAGVTIPIIPQETRAALDSVCTCRKHLYYNNDHKTRPECRAAAFCSSTVGCPVLLAEFLTRAQRQYRLSLYRAR